jgi:hypothetical protein
MDTKHVERGPSCLLLYGSWISNYLCNQCLSPLMLWVRISIRAWCTTLCDKVFQWLATGRWFSPGPPVSSTNKTYRHDITEILLKVAQTLASILHKRFVALYLFYQIDIWGLDFFPIFWVVTFDSQLMLDADLDKEVTKRRSLVVKLTWSHRKVYGRHYDLVNRYEISVLEMTTNMFRLKVSITLFFPSMTYYGILNTSSMTDATSGSETIQSSWPYYGTCMEFHLNSPSGSEEVA